ncbi:MAG: translation initiation factor IF-2 [Deltaproteobacteria bacterium]|nr:translation initiation factor IF-2 [Deltaproteobacteria bacterium]
MPRKRIHELAKEWGMETRQVLDKLEEVGIHGKKAASILTDHEIALARPAPPSPEVPSLVLGQEKVVAERVVTEMDQTSGHMVTSREEVRETRLDRNTIRRRPKREVVPEEELLLEEPQPELQAEQAFAPVAIEEPFVVAPAPLSFDLPLSEPVTLVSPPPSEASVPAVVSLPEPEASLPSPAEGAPPLVSAPELVVTQPEEPSISPPPPVTVREEPPPVVVTPEPHKERPMAVVPPPVTLKPVPMTAKPELGQEAPRPSRVLGRIDLGKIAAESKPRPAEVRPRVQPPTGPTAAAPSLNVAREPSVARDGEGPVAAAAKRPKKRKVIRKPELVEAQERDPRLARGGAKKKRVLVGKEQKQTEITVPKASKRVVRISEVITVGDLAHTLGVKASEVIKKLMSLGVMATINQVLDADTASLVAADFDYTVENVAFDVESALDGHEVQESDEQLVSRPPVVTIMGHVDHGKTSLLDAIRETNVTAQEQGGITQHIGAYSVQVNGRSVTFLDTPGHEAFTAMRARGAKVTDLVILVVAADDGVMPQTVEAINHARAAGVPVIVAVNKIDKPGADLERVKRELMNYSLLSEELGGETIFAPVSAKTGEGIPHLLEMILLQADVMELRAHAEKMARGTIVEAKLDRGRGPVATVLVQEGLLKVGDPFVCGAQYGRVRAMLDSWGNKVEKTFPSMPVEILGLSGVPEAGDHFVVVHDEATARQVAEHRRVKRRETELIKSGGRATLEDFYQQSQAGEVKELRVIIKADVQGSVEAVSDALSRLSTKEVKLTVLHSSVGGISESDVLLASASKGVIIGFNVRPESKAAQLAEREGVEIRLYGIIYEVIADIRAALEGLLEPTYREKPLGRAEVRQVFTISRVGLVAGCVVSEGRMVRGAQARLVRDHVVVHQGRIGGLRRFKDDVREVVSGTECGISLENFQDVKAGDMIEAYELEQILRRLETRPQEVERRV